MASSLPFLTSTAPTMWDNLAAHLGAWPPTYHKALDAEQRVLSRLSFFFPTETPYINTKAPNPPTNIVAMQSLAVSPWTVLAQQGQSSLRSTRALFGTYWGKLWSQQSSAELPRLASSTPRPAHSLSPHSSPRDAWTAQVGSVDIGQGDHIRTLVIRHSSTISVPPGHGIPATLLAPIVMAHGFAAGLGMYYRNYEAIARRTGRTIYGFDWLGMGLSYRPAQTPWAQYYPTRTGILGLSNSLAAEVGRNDDRIRETEDYFVESLERWRVAMGIERMVLVAHSFGGYMSALYAKRYPDRVVKLILVSPMGVSEPHAEIGEWTQALVEGRAEQLHPSIDISKQDEQRVKRVQKSLQSSHTSPTYDSDCSTLVASSDQDTEEPYGNGPTACNQIRGCTAASALPSPPQAAVDSCAADATGNILSPLAVMYIFRRAWIEGLSPQWYVRKAGLFGRWLLARVVENFPYLPENDRSDTLDYFYQLAAQPGSGEYCLTTLIYPIAHAKHPICQRMHGCRVPTTFVYGDSDWMDYRAAEQTMATMAGPTRLRFVRNAGHCMMMENPDDFNDLIIREVLHVQ
ncbi:hypothetical protein H4R35_001645 [Dimargaris xerosporica]|nr:hypothetical protein H4R35_001645 [Dimargaris xerosporica]